MLTPVDGYDHDGGEPSTRGAKYAKFDGATATMWFLREDGSALSRGPYYCPDVWEEHLKWVDKVVAERVRKQPGEPFPDAEELNEKTPRSEWGTDFNGRPQGPWRHTFNVGLVDVDSGERIVVSNSTVGMSMAYEALRDSVRFMKRGARVVPIIELDSAAMKTKKFGVKLRPSFRIVNYVSFGGSDVPAITAPVAAIAPVAPLTTAERIDDEIPDHPAPEPVRGGPKRRKKVGVVEPIPGFKTTDSTPDDGFPETW